MQTVEFIIEDDDKLTEYVAWAKNSAMFGEKTKEFKFKGSVFYHASHVSLVRHKEDPKLYIARLHCDGVEPIKETK
jgi:hypothetical protein